MSEHTAGPWQAVVVDGGHDIRMGTAIRSPYSYASHHVVEYHHNCDPKRHPEQFAEADANARLIAIAPVLLEALEEIQDAAEGDGLIGEDYRKFARRTARDAIARAKEADHA